MRGLDWWRRWRGRAKVRATERPPSTYALTRFAILRLLGVVYFTAFLVAVQQLLPLIGSEGLTPVGLFFDRVAGQLGGTGAGFWELPSVFWFNHSDAALMTVAWVGLALSAAVMLGYANGAMLLALWAGYLSIVHAGQEWYGYGWEIQLPETGFLAVFLVPFWDGRPFSRRVAPVAVIWLFRWLIFRVMLGAGLIKLRGDDAWTDLSILRYHFETQPIPNGLSRWFHFLPAWLLMAGVVFNHVAELVAPWLVFGPRRLRHAAGAVIVAFQLTLILSGNLSFFNWLTIVPALACFDDTWWRRLTPGVLRRRVDAALAEPVRARGLVIASWVLAAAVAVLSWPVVRNLASERQAMNTAFTPLKLVNTYGAFGTVGRVRYNVVFEGTRDTRIGPATAWTPYLYVGLPVKLDEGGPQIAPYQPHFDWQMWFAAMGSYQRYPWTVHLVWKLLHNDPRATGFFRENPFPDEPPRYVRAVRYRYRYVHDDERVWDRTPVDLWLPPLGVDNPELQNFLRTHGWLGTEDVGREARPTSE